MAEMLVKSLEPLRPAIHAILDQPNRAVSVPRHSVLHHWRRRSPKGSIRQFCSCDVCDSRSRLWVSAHSSGSVANLGEHRGQRSQGGAGDFTPILVTGLLLLGMLICIAFTGTMTALGGGTLVLVKPTPGRPMVRSATAE